jgi:hypothetical protein
MRWRTFALCLLWPLVAAAAEERPAVLWAAPPDPGKPADGLLFEVPAGLSLEALLPRPPGEQALYQALYPDGRTGPLQVIGLSQNSERLLARPPGACPPAAGPGSPDAGTPDMDMAPCQPPREGAPLALLLAATEPIDTPQLLSGAAITGVVRRRIGRQSLAARGRLIGSGASVAAVWKRRGEALQLAVFGEDGALRLFQNVPWRRTKKVAARPTAMFTLPDLAGPGQDGLLLVGAADSGPIYLVLQFVGRSVRAYP